MPVTPILILFLPMFITAPQEQLVEQLMQLLQNLFSTVLPKQQHIPTKGLAGGDFPTLPPALPHLKVLGYKFYRAKQFMLMEFSLKKKLMPQPIRTEH